MIVNMFVRSRNHDILILIQERKSYAAPIIPRSQSDVGYNNGATFYFPATQGDVRGNRRHVGLRCGRKISSRNLRILKTEGEDGGAGQH